VNALVNQVFPMLEWLTSLLPSWMTDWAKLVLLGILSSFITMLLYRALSDQDAIKQRKAEMKILQQRLIAADDDIKAVLELSRANLGHALALLGRVSGPAILSSLPVGVIVAWLAGYWTYAMPPPGTAVPMEITPSGTAIELTPSNLLAADAAGSQLIWPEPESTLRMASRGQTLWEGKADLLATTALVGQWRWWNAILGNPPGYLSPGGPLSLWSLDLPRREYLPFGMGWMRGWEFVYFATVLVVSSGLKLVMRIQ
jgi:uncharacterized membrane protein (DUF106 family)